MAGRPPSPRELLPEDQCHVWVVRVDQALASEEPFTGWLSDDERAGLRRYRFDRHRREHLATRALLRAALCRYTGVAPADFTFAAGSHGKPELRAPALEAAPAFNLTNCDGLAICALARVAELGVDVEPLTLRGDPHALAAVAFSPEERSDLRAAADPASTFVVLWTLKEAYVKARGLGLALPTQRFTVKLDGPATSLSFDSTVRDDPSGLQLARVTEVTGHHIAVVARHPRPLRMVVRQSETLEIC